MTKKDFEALAALLSKAAAREENGVSDVVEVLAEEIADFCKQKNPRFNRILFLRDCNATNVR